MRPRDREWLLGGRVRASNAIALGTTTSSTALRRSSGATAARPLSAAWAMAAYGGRSTGSEHPHTRSRIIYRCGGGMVQGDSGAKAAKGAT